MAKPKKPPPSLYGRLHYINELAAAQGLSQQKIAELLEVDKGTVSKWFNGGLPAEANLPRIAKLFNKPLAELFTNPDAPRLDPSIGLLPKDVSDQIIKEANDKITGARMMGKIGG